jgi:hypothetical protein
MGALKGSTIKVVIVEAPGILALKKGVKGPLFFVEIRGLLGPGRKGIFQATQPIKLARANAFKAKIEENLHLYLRPAPPKGKRKRVRKTAWQRINADKDHL